MNEKVTKPKQKKAPIAKESSQGMRLPALLLAGLVFLLPLIYLPASVAVLPSVKITLVTIVSVVAIAVVLVRALRDTSAMHAVRTNAITILGALLLIGYVVSTLFSNNVSISLFGRDFAQDSLLTMLVLFGLASLAACVARTVSYTMYVYTGLIVSGSIVAVVQMLNLLIPAFPSLGIFATNIASTLGKWNDVSLFAGLIIVLTLLALQHITFTKSVKIFLYVVAALNAVLAVVTNFTLTWWLLGIGAIVLLAQRVVRGSRIDMKSPSVIAVALLAISALFLAFGQYVAPRLSESLSIQHLEVRPSINATTQIAQQSLRGSDIVTGVGPALFEHVWPLYRPASVLETNFWNTDFRYGFGVIPTFVITTGIVGGVLWCMLILGLAWVTVRMIRTRVEHPQDVFLATASTITMWFLLTVAVMYLPSTTLFALLFVAIGLFVGSALRVGALPEISIPLPKTYHVIGKRMILGVVLVVLVLVLGKTTVKFIAHTQFQMAATALAANEDSARVETLLSRAATLDPIDTYARSLGEIGTTRLSRLVASANAGEQVDPNVFRALANTVIKHYESAISYDPQNYNNQLGLASFYTSLAALGTDGVYDAAKQLYSKALELKPNNPAVYLAIAQLELVNQNVPAARAAIDKAIELKKNYTDAYVLLTQLELSQGSRERATNVLKRAGAANPNDPFIYFQLGLLEYDNKNYTESVLALERAVSLNPQFQNAKYFLGLAYYEVNEIPSAIRQFEELVAQNQGNQELQAMLNNLRNGVAPIVRPQTIESLPLDDDAASVSDETLETVE